MCKTCKVCKMRVTFASERVYCVRSVCSVLYDVNRKVLCLLHSVSSVCLRFNPPPQARDSGEPLNPELLTESCNLFEEDLNPLFEYCIKYIESRSYIKSQQHKNNDFKEYINVSMSEVSGVLNLCYS